MLLVDKALSNLDGRMDALERLTHAAAADAVSSQDPYAEQVHHDLGSGFMAHGVPP